MTASLIVFAWVNAAIWGLIGWKLGHRHGRRYQVAIRLAMLEARQADENEEKR